MTRRADRSVAGTTMMLPIWDDPPHAVTITDRGQVRLVAFDTRDAVNLDPSEARRIADALWAAADQTEDQL